MSHRSVEQLGKTLPRHFSVSLIMQQSPAENPWIDSTWQAVGIIAGELGGEAEAPKSELILEQDGVRRYLYRGFTLRLHEDECESYYHNLMAPSPCCYVVATSGDDATPEPQLISLSFDEAHAYLEGDGNLYTVPMPAEIYQWTEAYVLTRFVPEKRTKRRRRDWRQNEEVIPE